MKRLSDHLPTGKAPAVPEPEPSVPATVPRAALPAIPAAEAEGILLAAPSAALGTALAAAEKVAAGPWSYTAGDGSTVWVQPRPIVASSEVAAEATRRLAAIRAALDARAPASAAAKWLYRLAQLCERPPVGEDLDEAVKALGARLDLPARCFTDATLAPVARAVTWWPGLAKLEGALAPFHEPLRTEAERLEAVILAHRQAEAAARAPALPRQHEPRRVPTEEERAAVAAKVAAFKAEMQGRREGEPRRPAAGISSYLSDRNIALTLLRDLKREEAGRGAFVAPLRHRLDTLCDRCGFDRAELEEELAQIQGVPAAPAPAFPAHARAVSGGRDVSRAA